MYSRIQYEYSKLSARQNQLYGGIGENILQNNLYNSYQTLNGIPVHYDWQDMDKIASSTVNGWMNSPGHRSNILGYYHSQGIGVAISSDDKVYITEDFC